MKNLFLTFVFIFAITYSFAFNNSTIKEMDEEEMVNIILSCGGTATYDDTGMSLEESFDAAAFIDWASCEGSYAHWY